jgi:hypothetical protein
MSERVPNTPLDGQRLEFTLLYGGDTFGVQQELEERRPVSAKRK